MYRNNFFCTLRVFRVNTPDDIEVTAGRIRKNISCHKLWHLSFWDQAWPKSWASDCRDLQLERARKWAVVYSYSEQKKCDGN